MITAIFTDPQKTKIATSDEVWQFDYGQILQIEGLELPESVEIDFSFGETGESMAYIMGGQTADGVTTVNIPDEMFNCRKKRDYKVYAYVYEADPSAGETTYKIEIPVMTRPYREEYTGSTGEDNPYTAIVEQVTEAAQTATEAATTAQQILDTIENSLVGLVSLYVTKEDGVTTIIATAEDGEEHTCVIEDGKIGYSYTESEETINLKSEIETEEEPDNTEPDDTEPDSEED